MIFDWKILALGGFIFGSTLGVWRAADRAEIREAIVPEFYFVSSHDWLCIQQKWGDQHGLSDAIRAWGDTVSATTDPASAAAVGATKTQIESGRALDLCEEAQPGVRLPPSKESQCL